MSSPNASKETRVAPIIATPPSDDVSKRKIETPRSTFSEAHVEALVSVIQDVVNLSVDENDQEGHILEAYCGSAFNPHFNTAVNSSDKPVTPKSKSTQDKLRSLVPSALKTGNVAKKSEQKLDTDEIDMQPFAVENSPPITDIAVVFSGDSIPRGYEKIEKSPTGIRADMNKGSRGQFVYLCVKKDGNSKKTPISEIMIILPERGETPPSGYQYIRRRGVPVNLNTGTMGEKIFICVQRLFTSWLTDLIVLFPKKGESLPHGYMRVDRTPQGHCANANTSTGGTDVYICYKKQISYADTILTRCYRPTSVRQSSLRSFWNDNAESTVGSPIGGHGPPSPGSRLSAFSYMSMPHMVKDQKAIEVRKESFVGGLINTVAEELTKTLVATDFIDTNDDGYDSEYECLEEEDGHDFSKLRDAGSTERLDRAVSPQQCQYIFPIIIACFIRHGKAASVAVHGLENCLEAGVFDSDFSNRTVECSTLLDIAVAASCNTAYQGVYDKFPAVKSFLKKVVNKSIGGLRPQTLHRIIEVLTYMEDCCAGSSKDDLRHLTKVIMDRIEERSQVGPLSETSNFIKSSHFKKSSESMLFCLVSEVVGEVVEGIELAKSTEHVMSCCRSHANIHSSNFWRDLYWASENLTDTLHDRNVCQLIATFSKITETLIKKLQQDSGEKDLERLNLILFLMREILVLGGKHFRESKLFGHIIRRFVCPVVTSSCAIADESIFRQVLTLISALWNNYRRHLKIELALLFETILLRILKNPSTSCVSKQTAIIMELTPWFQLPHNMIEMFLNFDMDRQYVQHWKIFEQLCGALCTIAEGSTNAQATEDNAIMGLQFLGMDTILAILRSLMDASGHAHLISRDAKTRAFSLQHGGWEQDDFLDSTQAPGTVPRYRKMTVRMRNEMQKMSQEILRKAFEISQSKSLKKSIEYLVAMNFLSETPRDIASFLRIHHDDIDEADIGDYLGEGDGEFKVHVRLAYVRAVSFTGLSLVAALRKFLTNGGFRLPGEAQKIERMVEVFAQCYWEDTPREFSSSDTVMVLAYSCIMLNTDLHNPQVKKNKMSRDQFVRNNRGIDAGKDIELYLLEDIYDNISKNPIRDICGRQNDPVPGSDVAGFQHGLSKAANQSEELMKGLSQSKRTFYFVGVDTNISPDLVKVLFENVWFHMLGLSTSILSNSQSALPIIMKCLDMLRFSISTCLFLGMRTEREAFAAQLAKIKYYRDSIDFGDRQEEYLINGEYRTESWYKKIDEAAATDDPWCVMGDIHILINELKESMQRRQTVETLKSVIKKINRGHKFLENTKVFIREGDLAKKCRSRYRTYRFFLFNDQLMYADKGMSGKWNPHNSLRLRLTRVVDVPDTLLQKNAFQILNPVKSFVVHADSRSSKASWFRDIKDAISEANMRTLISTRRISLSSQDVTDENTAPAQTIFGFLSEILS